MPQEHGHAVPIQLWLQGMTASDLNTLAALLAQQQDNGGIALTSALGTPVAVSDPLASLDASIKGTLSPGNVSLLKPWGQCMPEVICQHLMHGIAQQFLLILCMKGSTWHTPARQFASADLS